MQRAPGTRQPRFYLVAAPLIPQTPFAEVLTVVGQQSVRIFASRERARRITSRRSKFGGASDLTQPGWPPVKRAREISSTGPL
jgi:hypothetical protein